MGAGLGHCGEDCTMKRRALISRVLRDARNGWSWWVPVWVVLLVVGAYVVNRLLRGEL